jgi:hypothetical protein
MRGVWQARGVLFPERSGYPLFDADEYVRDPAFWVIHLYWVQDAKVSVSMLGIDPADADELYSKIDDPERWPYIRVPLVDGGHYGVIYRNFPDDYGVDYEHVGKDGHIRELATTEGGGTAPVLEWDELVIAATQIPTGAAGVADPLLRFLLLTQLLSDPAENAPSFVRETLGAATQADARVVDFAATIMQIWLTE